MKKPRATLKTRLITLAILILSNFQAFAGPDPEGLAAFVERGMELWHVPGMAVTVVSSDEVLFRQGFGRTIIRDGVNIGEHTLFANASTTKAMVAAGILLLVDEEKLTLDDAVVKYIPELRFSDPMLTDQITVRDLLTHRTGLPSTDFWVFFMNMPLEEQIGRLAAVPPEAPLRTRHIYQNTMYELAGLLIERIEGQRWDHFLRERLWQPLGMTETFGARGQIPAGMTHVTPHAYLDGDLSIAEWDLPPDLPFAAGSVWSSIHDMGLWAQFLLRGGVTAGGEQLLSEAAVQEMFRPQQLIAESDFYPTAKLTRPSWLSYGLGWFQQDFQGRKIDFHTGSLSGLIAIIGLDRAGDRAVVVLGNRDHAEMRHAVLWKVMENGHSEPELDWNQAVFDLYENSQEKGRERWEEIEKKRLANTKPSLPRENYAGRFDNAAIGQVLIDSSDQAMSLKMPNIVLPMSHWHLDTFLVEYESWALREFATFRIGPDGAIAGFELFGEQFDPVSAFE